MGRISFGELAVVLIIVLLLFGPSRLPSLAKSMGEALREFKKAQNEFDKPVNTEDASDLKEREVVETEDKDIGNKTENL